MHMAGNILLFTDFVTLYVVFLALFRDEGEKWAKHIWSLYVMNPCPVGFSREQKQNTDKIIEKWTVCLLCQAQLQVRPPHNNQNQDSKLSRNLHYTQLH